jgi:hypothetical protein
VTRAIPLLLPLALVLALARSTSAETLPWYRGFYTRIGLRDSFGVQEPFHAWAAFAFGVGYRYDNGCWGLDASALNVQYDTEEGMHTAGRLVAFQSLKYWTRADIWVGAGLSYGWVKGTVDQAIAKRRGEGVQTEAVVGVELPRSLRVRLFAQATLTAPLYYTRDIYRSRDSTLYVSAFETALGVRF